MTPEKPLILAVDDEPVNLQLLHKALQNDFRLIPAKNGYEALDRIEKYNPKVVLLDLQMPKMDGWEVLTELRKRGKLHNFRVVIVSAETDGITKARALSMGVRDYLTKPFDTDELMARIKMVLASRTDAEFARDIERHVDAAIAGVQSHFEDISKSIKDPDVRKKVERHMLKAESFFRSFMLWEKLQRAPLSLHETIVPAAILMDLIHNTYSEEDVKLRIGDHVNTTIFGDTSWLRMLFHNLIQACQRFATGYTPLRAELAGDGKELLIAISYMGDPIPPHILPYIFDPFPEEEGEETRPVIDMALPIAAIVTKRHNGKITYRQDGRWSTFVMTFKKA